MTTTQITPREWAANLVERGFVCVDVETTGLLQDPEAEVISLAIVDSTEQVLLSTYIKPTQPIDEMSKAFEVNRISNAMLEDAPTWEEVWPQAAALLWGKEAVAYNIKFDATMLWRMWRKKEYTQPNPGSIANWHCAMAWYAQYEGVPEIRMGRLGPLKFWNLATACINMGIEVAPDHSAVQDALATVLLIKKMAEVKL